MDLSEVRCESVKGIHVGHDRDQWQGLLYDNVHQL